MSNYQNVELLKSVKLSKRTICCIFEEILLWIEQLLGYQNYLLSTIIFKLHFRFPTRCQLIYRQDLFYIVSPWPNSLLVSPTNWWFTSIRSNINNNYKISIFFQLISIVSKFIMVKLKVVLKEHKTSQSFKTTNSLVLLLQLRRLNKYVLTQLTLKMTLLKSEVKTISMKIISMNIPT